MFLCWAQASEHAGFTLSEEQMLLKPFPCPHKQTSSATSPSSQPTLAGEIKAFCCWWEYFTETNARSREADYTR